MITVEEIDPPNFTLILRAYNGRMTGAVVWTEGDMVTSPERDLVDGEIEMAQPLLSVFAGEETMRKNVKVETKAPVKLHRLVALLAAHPEILAEGAAKSDLRWLLNEIETEIMSDL